MDYEFDDVADDYYDHLERDHDEEYIPDEEPTLDEIEDEYRDDGMSPIEADADTLRMAGWGTDEDYGFFGNDDFC